MTDERWQLAYAIYEAAAELAGPLQQEYVEAAASDAEIVGKVLEMLTEAGSEDVRSAVAPGTRLGPYEIESRIGQGGMGVVYRARDSRLDRTVAIKLLSPEMASDPQARERLRREAKAAASLDHPYICKIFEIGEDGGVLFLVMEFLAGTTLAQRMREGRMPLPEALRIAGEIAEAMQEAHARRILHRDLKPSNIMLTEQGHVKVMDFGLAKRIADDDSPDAVSAGLTIPGILLGTPAYMSPEQVKGLTLDARSDVFSFGAILAEMISGRNPFRRPTMAETLSAVLRDSPDFGGDIQGDTTVRGLVVMARRMLSKDGAERYASIADVRGDLARLAASSESATVTKPGPSTEHSAPIGRDAEFRQLDLQLGAALSGHGSLILIGGEPGIGKTHLSSALLDAARSRGAFTLTGHCYEMEGSPPYVPFIEMLEHSVRMLPRDTLRYALGDDAPEVARLMPELRQMYPDIPTAVVLPPEQQRRFLMNACRAFVERLARLTPIVVVFEDLHWADEPTVLLLQHLAMTVGEIPMLMIGTYRDVELDAELPWTRMLRQQKLGTSIFLRRLPVAGVEQMLAALSAQQPPRAFVRTLFEETEGNPFFVEEVFRHLVEEGRLFDERGAFRQDVRVDQLKVPKGVLLVVGRRLERLSEDTRRILTIAAVIGRAFAVELLEHLEARQPDAALNAVEEAELAQLIEAAGRGSQMRYRFAHQLVRQAVYETLSLPRRQRLHARVAAAMGHVYASNLDAHVSAIAHHLFQAGSAADRDKAIHFLLEAAGQASRTTAHEEALDHLDNAISLLDGEQTGRTADLLTHRAVVLLSLSRNPEAIQEYERALILFDLLDNPVRYAETCIRLHILHTWATQFHEVRSIIQRLDQRSDGAPAALRATVLAMRAHSASATGDIDRSLLLLEELRTIPESELPASVLAFVADQEMFARYGAGQFHLSEVAAQKAAGIYQRSGDLWSMSSIETGLLWPPVLCGRPAEAERQILEEAIPRAVRIGSDVAKSIGLWALSGAYVAAGRLEQAEQTARESLTLMESTRFGWAFVAQLMLGGILLHRGRTQEALTCLTNASARSAPLYSGFGEGLLAWGMTATGMEGAADARVRAMQFLPRSGVSRGIGTWNAVLCLIEALCLSGDRAAAGRLLVTAEAIAMEWDCSHAGFPARTAAGIAAACAGEWARADQHHRAAIARMDEVPYVTAQPIARYWYADMLIERQRVGDLEAAKAQLEASIAGSDKIGLVLYARLAKRRFAQIE